MQTVTGPETAAFAGDIGYAVAVKPVSRCFPPLGAIRCKSKQLSRYFRFQRKEREGNAIRRSVQLTNFATGLSSPKTAVSSRPRWTSTRESAFSQVLTPGHRVTRAGRTYLGGRNLLAVVSVTEVTGLATASKAPGSVLAVRVLVTRLARALVDVLALLAFARLLKSREAFALVRTHDVLTRRVLVASARRKRRKHRCGCCGTSSSAGCVVRCLIWLLCGEIVQTD